MTCWCLKNETTSDFIVEQSIVILLIHSKIGDSEKLKIKKVLNKIKLANSVRVVKKRTTQFARTAF